jgi:hypothetical protein
MMHINIIPDNAHAYNQSGSAREHVPRVLSARPDFRCHEVGFARTLRGREVRRLMRVGISKQAVDKGIRLFPKLDIKKMEWGASVQFGAGEPRPITVLDVLERAYEQRMLPVEW